MCVCVCVCVFNPSLFLMNTIIHCTYTALPSYLATPNLVLRMVLQGDFRAGMSLNIHSFICRGWGGGAKNITGHGAPNT